MQKVSSIVLILAYLLVLGKSAMPWLEYRFNQDLIAQEYCVQKDEVKNCCQGKCYLNQRIKTEQGQSKDPAQTEILLHAELLYLRAEATYSPSPKIEAVKNVIPQNEIIAQTRSPQPQVPPPRCLFT